ncbi:MAG: acetyl-CoA carboxylase biotin carboxylase subunit [Deltaproteobacteria bacterium HGW-Deltaproteobacteria-1]|jgi:acetyl-CoA carboxylase biotin carboxylase subunit|nr:MAG: acetyl-CoA carboxylase biotin carboxylase subunit [Deltaproteobacteria bacterium HGW-Deltaproteobacteria-1]
MKKFQKILIASRGEIAVRIIRTCKDMSIRTVAVFSQADADALHVRLADETYEIGPPEAAESYLNFEKIVAVAKQSGADAIHPGYGFLSENPEFVELCERENIVFIGPSSQCMFKAKPKNRARQLMKMINIPVTPGCDDAIASGAEEGRARAIAAEIGYPVIVKPSGGGGGIGIMIARNEDELSKAIAGAETRGRKAFGTSSFYIEKYLHGMKHVEFQVLADQYGNVVHLGERDCSVQRRFQKLVEEAPCPIVSPFWRMKMGAAAIDVALALDYVGALTVEFFYFPEERKFYFNEINSRLQVEHCVTEMVTGIDIVREQIRIAEGEELSFNQDDIRIRVHAVECRINAEDALRNFIPSPGMIRKLILPHGLGIRIDEGIYEGYNFPFYYDSLMMKIMSVGKTRADAIARMQRALGEIELQGPKTTLPFHHVILKEEDFVSGNYTTDLADRPDIKNKLKP